MKALNFFRTGLLYLLAVISLYAQNEDRYFTGLADKGSYIQVYTNDGHYRIRYYSDKIVETTFVPDGESFDPVSHAVVLNSEAPGVSINQQATTILLSTTGMSVNIQKSPFQLSYYYRGKLLTSERRGYERTEAFQVLDFNLSGSEVLYGGGARALDMNRRGYRLQLYNQAHYGYENHSELMNFSLPLVYSSRLYGLHFDNAPKGYLDLDSQQENSLRYEAISGRKTYQVMAGDSWQDLVGQYTKLTGRQPLIPRWALGNFSSRFGYHSQAETVSTVAEFIAAGIPVDAVILDLYWFGKTVKGTMGNLAFQPDAFPDPKKMIADFRKQGIRTVLITEPFVLTSSDRWQEAVDNEVLCLDIQGKPYTYDFYFGHTGLIDLFKPGARDWFWQHYQRLVQDYGVSGWWGDLGEPEVHPSDLLHATGTADELHNIYGHYWAKMIYDGYQQVFPEQRPFILMRAGYAGSQHYGLIPWSGDVSRSWGGLQSQPSIALQMGMQGLAYMHSDLGGFAGDNVDDELYLRWMQYGVFQPVYRPHAQESVPSEPVFRTPRTRELAKEAILLRYQLLPYNYTLAFENHQEGTPLMRPLFFEEDKKALLTDDKTYLWGPHLLISPVVQPGLTAQEVYFPSGANWYDFYTDQQMIGGAAQVVPLREASIPTYVRGGSFIPMARPLRNTDSYDLQQFDLHYYYDPSVPESKDQLYHDDGQTPQAFEKGMYELLHFEARNERRQLVITLKARTGAHYKTAERQLNLVIHQVKTNPKRVRLGRKALKHTVYDAQHKTLSIPITWDSARSVELVLRW